MGKKDKDRKLKIDAANNRYPYCLVWTPLPMISYILPFLSIGHVGICTSEGVIHDFGGSKFISVDQMSFNDPFKYL